ncbi:hypothetical protein [Priestia megaterium]|uniref:hypothetical protein n=1 Tax=Priestia megaterium TaxID=1404 RepID=UPI00209F5B63|nr:hypothetical protein [Priestia megaterium]MCP1452306.1 hypothetical protein [Priestia megaterium]
MKKFLVLAMPFIFLLGLTFNFEVNAASNQITVEDQKQSYKERLANLTRDEVIANFEIFDKEYVMEEPFSFKNQTFVKMYAKNPSAITLFSLKGISISNSSNGFTVKVSGTIKDDIQNVFNQSFSTSNLKTSTTAGASKAYSGTLSTLGKDTTLTATKRYTAVVAYASTGCTVTVKHSGGTFTVNPK